MILMSAMAGLVPAPQSTCHRLLSLWDACGRGQFLTASNATACYDDAVAHKVKQAMPRVSSGTSPSPWSL